MTEHYELMTILNIDLGEEGAKALSAQIKELITSLKGTVIESNFWGKRKFAYELNHATEGFYDVLKFEMERLALDKFKSKLNHMDNLVRYLITAIEK